MAWNSIDVPPSEAELAAWGPLTHDAITAHYRVWQRKHGHRYSLDDLATAFIAVRAAPDAKRVLDLGCGIGSVLHMLAWRLPTAMLYGVEAQAPSAALAARSVADNGLAGRVRVLEGDLREAHRAWSGEAVDLVTGTPPYLPVGTALPSPDPQRQGARLELRGGVEAYLAAMAAVVRPGGLSVLCFDARHPLRVLKGAREAGLRPVERMGFTPRPGAVPLFDVWTLVLPPGEERGTSALCPGPEAVDALPYPTRLMRDALGKRTAFAQAMRHAFGFMPKGG